MNMPIWFRVECWRGRLSRGKLLFPAILLVTSLAGCGGDSAEATVTPAASPIATHVPATPTPVPPAEVGEVVWATGVISGTNAPDGIVDSFETSALALYAVCRVTNLRASSVLSASWTYNDVSLEAVTTGTVPGSAFSAGYVQFHLKRDGNVAWPDGAYAIVVSLDGNVVQTAQIEVRST